MSLSEDDVLHAARLARLRLTHEEAARLVRDLGAVLAYMDMLGEIDTQGVVPTFHAHSRTNALREDSLAPSLEVHEALGNAPCIHGVSFEVPRIIEED